MKFWIYMFIMDLLLPVMMICFGKIFRNRAPREINAVFGYRTSMSMKNKETWEFAHRYCGRLWYVLGWMMLVITAAVMLFAMGKSIEVVGMAGAIVMGVQLVPLVGSIIPTEMALRKTFDKNGNRK